MLLSRSDMHEYQNRAVRLIKRLKRCALFLDLGMGKSVTTLTAVSDLLDGCVAKKVLVISPLRVANSVWPKEPQNWQHLKHLKVVTVTGSEKNRRAALHCNADIYSINRENVPWLVTLLGNNWPFDVVVIDESSSFKNASSKRWKALKRVLPNTEYMILLTGTPSPNGLLDLWSQVYLIDFGMSLGRTFTTYKQRFFEADFMGYKHTPREGSDEKIHQLISPFCLSMNASDYLELPERIDLVERVYLDAKTLKAYQSFEKSLLAELDTGEIIEATTAATLANKLLQWCNGATYVDDKGNWAEIHNAKLDALEELIEQNENETMLVAYNYKTDLERLQKRFPDAVVLDKDPETIEKWNSGKIKLLLAHPASAGHGLNLQHGGSLCVWFGLNWSLELYQQFNARLHRQGQTKPVRVIHIVVDGCMDERVVEVLKDKDAIQSNLLKALKADLIEQNIIS